MFILVPPDIPKYFDVLLADSSCETIDVKLEPELWIPAGILTDFWVRFIDVPSPMSLDVCAPTAACLLYTPC